MTTRGSSGHRLFYFPGMIGPWIKVRVLLPSDPKVITMTEWLAQHRPFIAWLTELPQGDPDLPTSAGNVTNCHVLRSVTVTALIKIWGLCAERGKRSGELDLIVSHASLATLDEVAGVPGIGQAMKNVDWAKELPGPQVLLPNYLEEGSLAEERKEADRLRQQRYRERKARERAPDVTRDCHDRGEEIREEEIPISSPRSVPGSPIGAGERGEPGGLLPTDDIPWGSVVARAQKVAMLVPPRSVADRRAWLRYAVLSTGPLTEAWLIDAAEAVRASPKSGKKQGHFVAVLKSKAAEAGIDAATLLGMARRIEIPEDVWDADLPALRPAR